MKITTKGRYAVQAMLLLAINHNSRAITLTQITENQNISVSYFEQLFSRLRTSGLVQGVRGPGGGYRLSKLPSEISIADILVSVDPPSDTLNHDSYLHRDTDAKQSSKKLWLDFSNRLLTFLDSIYLTDLLKDQAKPENQVIVDKKSHQISTMFPVSKPKYVA